MAVEVWVRPPARACPGAGSHRPGVPEGHAHEAVWQRQVRRWRSGLRSVDRSARTQRRAQGARRLGGLLGDPWLQANPEEEAAGVPGLAGGPRGARAWSRPKRVDLQLEDAGRPCLGRKGVYRVRGLRGPRRLIRPTPPPQDPRVAHPPIHPFHSGSDLGKEKERQDHRRGEELGHLRGDHGLPEVLGAAAAGSGALYLRGQLRPFGQPPAPGDPRGGGRRGRRACWSSRETVSWPQAMQ